MISGLDDVKAKSDNRLHLSAQFGQVFSSLIRMSREKIIIESV